MKLGCAVGSFTTDHYAAPYEEPIRKIGELGFQGIELIAAEPEDLESYYTPGKIAELCDQIGSYGMEVSEFILYAHLLTGLAERDPAEKNKALDIFRRGAEVAKAFGTDKINMVSNWPNELRAPIPYVPSFFHPNVNGVERWEPKLAMELPPRYDARGAWENYMESLELLVELCEEMDLTLCLEGHCNVEVGTTDAFLRAADRIQSPRFCTNFDAAWQLVQREYLPWSVYKLGDKIKHVHLRDGDGMLNYSLPPGMGIIDWHGFVRALKEVGFDGVLSFELGGFARPEEHIAWSKEYMTRVLADEGCLG